MAEQNIQEQIENLNRVETKIGPIVLKFLKEKGENADFHMQDLQEYVSNFTMISPDSPSRILRDLKKKGEIDYEVISRSQSHYRFHGFNDVRKSKPLKELLSNLGLESLDEYFASEIWQNRKADYYFKYPKVCFITGSTENVQLHHLTYERLGNELDEDLVPLRKFWHEYVHHLVKTHKVKLKIAHIVAKENYKVSLLYERKYT